MGQSNAKNKKTIEEDFRSLSISPEDEINFVDSMGTFRSIERKLSISSTPYIEKLPQEIGLVVFSFVSKVILKFF